VTKDKDRVPRWKIVAVLVGSAVAGAALLVAHVALQPDQVTTAPTGTPDPTRAAMNMAGLLLIIGLVCLAVTIICIAVLAYRYYLAAIPAWKRRKGPPKRR
jgi:hypothetical protein